MKIEPIEKVKQEYDVFDSFLIVRVQYLPAELRTESGLILGFNNTPAEKTIYFGGVIIAVGDAVVNKKLKLGMRVLVKAFSGQKVYHLGDENADNDYVRFDESDIAAVMDQTVDLTPIKNFTLIDREALKLKNPNFPINNITL